MRCKAVPSVGGGSCRPGALRLPCLLAVLLAAARTAAAAGTTEAQLAALKRRVQGLEISVGPSAAAVVSTIAARDAGAATRPGSGDAPKVLSLIALVSARNGPALTEELRRLLSQGVIAYPTLLDFCHELDRDARQANPLTFNYFLAFSLVHLPVLQRDELARFAHCYLAATQGSPRAPLRRTVIEWLPDLLRYHRGRYPDLERALETEVVEKLREGKGNLQIYYTAMQILGLHPPLDIFDSILEAASSHAEILPAAKHLEAVNDASAASVLARNVARIPPGQEWKARLLFSSLVRMTDPAAQKAMRRFLQTSEEHLQGTAFEAYVTLPREEGDLPLLQDYLNSPVSLEPKRWVIMRLAQNNPGVLASLKAHSEKIESEEVRKLLDNPRPAARKTP